MEYLFRPFYSPADILVPDVTCDHPEIIDSLNDIHEARSEVETLRVLRAVRINAVLSQRERDYRIIAGDSKVCGTCGRQTNA
jgi:hypothetical protein